MLTIRDAGRILDVTTTVAQKALARLGTVREWEGQTGAILCVADPFNGDLYFRAPILSPPLEKVEKYTALASEKAARLGQNVNKWSSYATRDPDFRSPENSWGRFGGAIWTPSCILSASGFPELGDEAINLVSAIKLRFLQYERPNDRHIIKTIAELSDNEYFRLLETELCFEERQAAHAA